MKETTLCYIERGREYLMLHRVKKVGDANHDKWIGVGGHLEPGETPEQCVLREVYEETGLTLPAPRARGVIDFHSDEWPSERMWLYTADTWTGTLRSDCDEGVLEWLDRDRMLSLPMWEGDRIFLRLLNEDAPYFTLTLTYHGERLTSAILNGEPISL